MAEQNSLWARIVNRKTDETAEPTPQPEPYPSVAAGTTRRPDLSPRPARPIPSLDLPSGSRPVLFHVTTADAFRPLAFLADDLDHVGVDLVVLHWEDLLVMDAVPGGGVWLTTATERLSRSERIHAAAVAREIRAGGARTLNDPSKARDRVQTIQALRQMGLSPFRCWSPAAGEWPDRYPVFLRGCTGHRGAMLPVLEDEAAARARLDQALEEGEVLSDLLFVEFVAEPLRDDHWQKHSIYRIGDAFVPALVTNEKTWHAKYGSRGLAADEDYAREAEELDAPVHMDRARAIFDAMEMEYGRLDYGIVGGELVPYEVNTNPTMQFFFDHPNAARVETIRRIHDRTVRALAALARPIAGEVALNPRKRVSKVNPGLARRH